MYMNILGVYYVCLSPTQKYTSTHCLNIFCLYQISTPSKKKKDRRDQVSVPQRQQVRMAKEAGYGNSHLQPQHLSLIMYLRPSHLTKQRVSKTAQWLKMPATNACNWNLICIWKERISPTSCLLTAISML